MYQMIEETDATLLSASVERPIMERKALASASQSASVTNRLVISTWTRLSISQLAKRFQHLFGYAKITHWAFKLSCHSFKCYRSVRNRFESLNKHWIGTSYREISSHFELVFHSSWQWRRLSLSKISNLNDKKILSLRSIIIYRNNERNQCENITQIWTTEKVNYSPFILKRM